MGVVLIFLLLVLVVSTMNNSGSNGGKDDDAKDFLGYMDEINRKKWITTFTIHKFLAGLYLFPVFICT